MSLIESKYCETRRDKLIFLSFSALSFCIRHSATTIIKQRLRAFTSATHIIIEFRRPFFVVCSQSYVADYGHCLGLLEFTTLALCEGAVSGQV